MICCVEFVCVNSPQQLVFSSGRDLQIDTLKTELDFLKTELEKVKTEVKAFELPEAWISASD